MWNDEVSATQLEPLEFPKEFTGIAFTTKQIYKLGINYGIVAFFIYIANCYLETWADGSLIPTSVIHLSWSNRIKCQNVPQIRIATKKLLPLDRFVLLHLCYGKSSTLIRFGVARSMQMTCSTVHHSQIASFVKCSLKNGKQLFRTHIQSQYWKVQSHLSICIQRVAHYKIWTKLKIKMCKTKPPLKLLVWSGKTGYNQIHNTEFPPQKVTRSSFH